MKNPYFPETCYPKLAVWELTFACNMNCRHCGSIAGGIHRTRLQELSTDEAFSLADQLAELGNERITLSGGELFLRKDWHLIAARLKGHGVRVGLITNGFLLQQNLDKIRALLPLDVVAISLDGTRETHNYIRRVPRAFDRVLEGFRKLQEMGVYTAAVTSVSKRNLSELPRVYEILSEAGVKAWQIQLIIGEGRMRSNEDMPQPADLEGIAKFMVAKRRTSSMNIYPGDNIGFFTSLERELRNSPWRGCFAGILSIGIEANGNIKGCLSQCPEFMENNPFVEGNIREKSLREIWENPEGFSYNRKFHLGKVKGFCRTCKHIKECRCGCTATAYAIHGTKYENSYCIYQCVYNRNRGLPVPTYQHTS